MTEPEGVGSRMVYAEAVFSVNVGKKLYPAKKAAQSIALQEVRRRTTPVVKHLPPQFETYEVRGCVDFGAYWTVEVVARKGLKT